MSHLVPADDDDLAFFLEDMACPVVTLVVFPGVDTVDLSHMLREVRPGCLDDEMVVVIPESTPYGVVVIRQDKETPNRCDKNDDTPVRTSATKQLLVLRQTRTDVCCTISGEVTKQRL